jgi:hypothetical protein
MMIITTTAMLVVQSIILTWIIITSPEPCPQEYVGNVEYCELTYVGYNPHAAWPRTQWSLKE